MQSGELARTKRFLERVAGSDALRQRLATAPELASQELGLDVEELRPLWDAGARHLATSERVDHYRAWLDSKLELRDAFRRDSAPTHPLLRRWRERQMARCSWELSTDAALAIIHAPVAFELCQGCSVGCWFCGVGAVKFRQAAAYDPAFWQGLLTALAARLGPGAGHGFCYWATDPLDNPDYERFCLDFWSILGRFPQTTTALALKDPGRTRALLRLSEQHGCPVNRFSVLSQGQLERIHAEFSPEELERVELVLQNPQSQVVKAYAGKARESERVKPQDPTESSTIACVSGFLINLVERRVRLISPCSAGPRWPLGYRVHSEGEFASPAEFAALLDRMLDPVVLRDTLPLEEPLAWRTGLQLTLDGSGGFVLETRFQRADFPVSAAYPALAELARVLAEGSSTGEQLASAMPCEPARTLFVLEEFYRLGLLEDDPLP